METTLIKVKWLIAFTGGFLTNLLGGWDVALRVLALFCALDYVTGVAAAYVKKTLNSDVGHRGILRKVLIFAVIAVAYWLDQLTGQHVLRSLVIFYYIANEGLSIIENLGRAGVPIPQSLKTALEALKHKAEGRKGENNAT